MPSVLQRIALKLSYLDSHALSFARRKVFLQEAVKRAIVETLLSLPQVLEDNLWIASGLGVGSAKLGNVIGNVRLAAVP